MAFLRFALVALVVASSLVADAASTPHYARHVVPIRRIHHQQLTNRLSPRAFDSPNTPPVKQSRKRRSCRPRQSQSQSITVTATSEAPTSTTSKDSPPTPKPTPTTTKAAAAPPPPTTTKANNGGNGGNGGNAKPANWPNQTQAGAAPTATRTSPADPYLNELSKSYNNANNPLYNTVHKGDMTYYGQGLGACGDTYDDNSFTAAVSQLLYDAWPGATAETNRNPICGPFVPGRRTLSDSGRFITAVPGQSFVNVGGDGLLNCDPSPSVQCHIPLTATVRHGGKSIVVKIVDRCEGCKPGDIDLTPAAFAALADPALGRTDVEWEFNKY
ncbi:hypothetical protein DXG03_007888 [Asterophora parasitica]|uniref:RlpA-like protein double-psi beta-barrel domain-containing protein n=1 Tax=Asterophora parasitica TaxID=117018 RepID=A0A9P7G4I0_9AGAR|nr:hypothetical protein DXG03_007888 [Asterophora parasitica]